MFIVKDNVKLKIVTLHRCAQNYKILFNLTSYLKNKLKIRMILLLIPLPYALISADSNPH